MSIYVSALRLRPSIYSAFQKLTQLETTATEKLMQLEFLGISLKIGVFVSLVMALSFGDTEYNWSAGREIALWVVRVLMLSFATQQAFMIGTTLMARFFPVDFLRKKLMRILYTLMSAAATFGFVRDFPLYTKCCELGV